MENIKKSLFMNDSIDFENESSMRNCFRLYDNEYKGYLDEKDFFELSTALISEKTKPSLVESNEFFSVFDNNGDGKIDWDEFQIVWNKWIKKLVRPVSALIVIDIQNDFVDGSLALRNCSAKQDANEIIPIINDLIDNFDFKVVAYTMDQHPHDHISFLDNVKLYKLADEESKQDSFKLFDSVVFKGPPKFEQKLWPKHCVQGTCGAELHPKLKVKKSSLFVSKGTKSEIDSYSAFYDNLKLSHTNLHKELQQNNVTHVFACGVAYEYCVASTIFDALDLGYATILLEDATRGTDVTYITMKRLELERKGSFVTNSDELRDLLTGKCIRKEFAESFVKSV